MSLRFSAILEVVGGRKAAAEVRGVSQAADDLRAATGQLDAGATGAATAIDKVGAEARTTTTLLGRLRASAAATFARIRGGASGAGETTQIAAGSVGNLTAQFNDLGVMMAAGQNPFQLAIQQGTQITQVIGPMGARGAVRALGTAFMGLLSPVNLITLGAIAAGAAFVQWLTRSKEDADDLQDRLDKVNARLAEAQETIRVFETGAGSSERLAILDRIVAAEERLQEARRQQEALPRALRGAPDVRNRVELAREELELAQQQLADFEAAIAREREILALEEERKRAAEELAASQEKSRQTAREMLATTTRQNALMEIAARHGEDSSELARARAAAEREAAAALLDGVPGAGDLREELLQAMEHQERLNWLIDHADLSGLSGQARLLAEYMGFSADEAERFNAALNMAAGLSDVTPSEGGLSYGLPSADQGDLGVGYANLGYGDLSGRPPRTRIDRTPPRSSSGSGAARAKREERDAVQELIDRYREEIDILNEADPVQQELIRHREVLAKATDGQRAAIEQLIREEQTLEAQQQRTAEMADWVGQVSMDVFGDLRRGGDDAAAAWGRVGDAIEQAILQAAILGDGPLGGAFGPGLVPSLFGLGGNNAAAGATGAGGNWLTNTISGLLGFDEGGMVSGQGGPRDDKELVRVSPGEFIVRATAAAEHRALLEAINAGAALPRYANGGMIGGGAAADTGSDQAPSLVIEDHTSRGAPAMAQGSRKGPGGRRLSTLVMADTVAQALTLVGGAAYEVQRRNGVTPKRPSR